MRPARAPRPLRPRHPPPRRRARQRLLGPRVRAGDVGRGGAVPRRRRGDLPPQRRAAGDARVEHEAADVLGGAGAARGRLPLPHDGARPRRAARRYPRRRPRGRGPRRPRLLAPRVGGDRRPRLPAAVGRLAALPRHPCRGRTRGGRRELVHRPAPRPWLGVGRPRGVVRRRGERAPVQRGLRAPPGRARRQRRRPRPRRVAPRRRTDADLRFRHHRTARFRHREHRVRPRPVHRLRDGVGPHLRGPRAGELSRSPSPTRSASSRRP